jgi:hypothetical protein
MAKELKWSWREKARQLKEAQETIKTFGGPFPVKGVVEQKFSTIQDVRDLFRSMDHAGNDYIDFVEFKGCLEALGIPFPNDKAAMKQFKKLDKDSNGKIYEEEFISWWQGSSSDKLKKNLGEKVKLSADKLGKGSGVAFG